MQTPIPDYQGLDASGEALAAATRMENRAQTAASAEMYRRLARPLLRGKSRILEVGCGPGALARRIKRDCPEAFVCATDLSEGMLAFARERGLDVTFGQWDVRNPADFPFDGGGFDLIISSVMLIYLSDEDVIRVVADLAARLRPGGVTAFIEQDLMTDSLASSYGDVTHAIFGKEERPWRPTVGSDLPDVLRHAGLKSLPTKSFVWSDEAYGPYTREHLGRSALYAVHAGRITDEQAQSWLEDLERRSAAGRFAYRLVYHRFAAFRMAAK